jgi:hypothetical protein
MMTRQEIQTVLEGMVPDQNLTLQLHRGGEHQANITASWNGIDYLIHFEVFQTCQTTQQLQNVGATALALFEEARRWEKVHMVELYEVY